MLNNLEKAILFVSTCGAITYKKQYKLVFETNVENLITDFDLYLSEVKSILSDKELNELKSNFDLSKLNNYVLNLEKSNISVITIKSNFSLYSSKLQ